MTESYNRLWEGMLDNAIDESLRVKPYKSLGITMQTIVFARKYIQGEDFELLYSIVHKQKCTDLVRMLRWMWCDLGKYPEHSHEFRQFFKPDYDKVKERGQSDLVLKHPDDWFWTRLTGYMEKWK